MYAGEAGGVYGVVVATVTISVERAVELAVVLFFVVDVEMVAVKASVIVERYF